MEQSSNIPEELDAPKHRGEAYTRIEKNIAISESKFSGITVLIDKVPCVTINFYPVGEDTDGDLGRG